METFLCKVQQLLLQHEEINLQHKNVLHDKRKSILQYTGLFCNIL